MFFLQYVLTSVLKLYKAFKAQFIVWNFTLLCRLCILCKNWWWRLVIKKILIEMVKTWFMEYAINPTAFAAKVGSHWNTDCNLYQWCETIYDWTLGRECSVGRGEACKRKRGGFPRFFFFFFVWFLVYWVILFVAVVAVVFYCLCFVSLLYTGVTWR